MLTDDILQAHANPCLKDGPFDLHGALEKVLQGVGCASASSGGTISFHGRDPVVPSAFRLASAAAIGLVAKSVAMAHLWRLREGEGQDISVDLGQALHRMSPFYEKKWELLNGYPPGMPSDPTGAFMPHHIYPTRDGRHVLALNIYPSLKSKALRFLNCADSPKAIAAAIGKWDGIALEQAAEEQGLQTTMVRSMEEFLREEQGQVLANMPLIALEKIGESAPEPLLQKGDQPLSGIRALGCGHVIAGAGLGRALALHGADVLNIWRPSQFEFDLMYCTANVGMRSSTLELAGQAGLATFKTLLQGADILFANRRPGWLEGLGLGAEEVAALRPGIVHVTISLFGQTGPWKNRIGFDQAAGAATGILACEGTLQAPRLPAVFVVNDYLVAWLAALGVGAALARRATEGGSYRVHVSLARVAMWLHTLGVMDKSYAAAVAGTEPDHVYHAPDLFTAKTPCGFYQGVTDQVQMSHTPGYYQTVLLPRGAAKPEWLPRELAVSGVSGLQASPCA